MEIVQRLEQEGYEGTLWLIDGAPEFLQTLTNKLIPEDDVNGELNLQVQIILRFIDLVWPQESIAWVCSFQIILSDLLHSDYVFFYSKSIFYIFLYRP